MVEGKEIGVFSMAFAAGVATGIFLYGVSCNAGRFEGEASYSAAALSAIAAIFCAAWAARTVYRESRTGAFLLVAAFFFTGMLTAIVRGMADMPGTAGVLLPAAAGTAGAAAESLRDFIDSLPLEDPENNALIKALITGDRSSLSPETTQAFRDSGASHLLALSGMHLGIIYIILVRTLSFMGNSPAAKRTRSALIIAATGFYSVMTGAGDSIIRAFLFIVFRETAISANRLSRPLNIFFGALTIQLCFDPACIGSVGFQLSYLAVAGIFVLNPKLRSWYIPGKLKCDPMKAIWNAASLSISCQLFTAPAVWIHFGTFPVYFLITNLIAIPLTSLSMNISIAVLLLYASGVCPPFLLSACKHSIELLRESLEIIGSL